MLMREITNTDEKSAICDMILHSLPDWFGNEAAIVDYTAQVQNMPFYCAFNADIPIGFVALKLHNAHTGEVCVMGIKVEHHRNGVGRKLIEWCERACRDSGREFLTVKTLDESAKSESYSRTRQFYKATGFIPLEVFPHHWDEANPCLFLAKYLR